MPLSKERYYTSEDYWNTPQGSQKMDYSAKNALYLDAGVREYWIVDPAKERTTVYRYEEDAAPMVFSFEQEISVGIYMDLLITISDLLK